MINNIVIILLPLLVGGAIYLVQRIVFAQEIRKLERDIVTDLKRDIAEINND